MDRSAKLRASYARHITELAGVEDQRIVRAFAAVPREVFIGPPPWFVVADSVRGYVQTPDDDLAQLYTDDLVALDPERGINNGQPSLHAKCLNALSLQNGQEVLHIGAGTGYYSAILAELVGPTGRVHAFEIDPELAARARRNLSAWPWVDVQSRSGTTGELPKAEVIYVNAGIAQPSTAWLAALRPGGQLLFPLQPTLRGYGFGAMLLLQKPQEGAVWPARLVCRASFISCQDIPDNEQLEPPLKEAFAGGGWQRVAGFRLNDAPDGSCWFRGDGWWLST